MLETLAIVAVKVHPKCSSSLMNPLLLRRNNFEAIASVRISVAKFLVFVSRTSTLPLSLRDVRTARFNDADGVSQIKCGFVALKFSHRGAKVAEEEECVFLTGDGPRRLITAAYM